MSARGKRLILIAFFIALALGTMLYFLSRPMPREVANPLSSVWWDDFESVYRIDELEGLSRDGGEIRLSQVHDLGSPVSGAARLENMTIGPDGRLFGTSLMHQSNQVRLFVYNPVDGESVDLGVLVSKSANIWALTISRDSHTVYAGVISTDGKTDARLLAYDMNSKIVRDLGAPIAGEHYLHTLVVSPDDLVYGAAGDHLFCYDLAEDQVTDLGPVSHVEDGHISALVLNGTEQLYGLGGSWDHNLFEYDLPSREVITLTEDEWSSGSDLILGTDGKLYGYGDRHVILQYDLASATLTSLNKPNEWGRFYQLKSGPDSSVYGVSSPFNSGEYLLFVYSTEEGFARLESLPDRGFSDLAVAFDGLVYIGQQGQSIYMPSGTSGGRSFFNKYLAPLTRWMDKWVPVPERGGGTTADFRYEDARLLVYRPGVFVRQGEVESALIKPHTSVVTCTEVSGPWTSVSALAWGGDGALYGVLSRPSHLDAGGVFRYTPAEVGRVTWVDTTSNGLTWPWWTSTLVAASDGRLVVILGGDMAIYDPRDSTLVMPTLPISQGARITALASGHDGKIYAAIEMHDSPPRLIAHDLTDGSTIDMGTPLNGTGEIYALTVAADGRVYGAGGAIGADEEPDQMLFVYDPSVDALTLARLHVPDSHHVSSLLIMPDGKVYIGTSAPYSGGNLFVYDPATGTVSTLPVGGNVIALALGEDGRIYGSAASPSGNGRLFMYDPRHPRLPPTIIGATPTGVTDLLPGPDGAMYGVTGQYNSFYNGATELIAFRTGCLTGTVGAWERVTWEAEIPRRTRVVVDVLDEEGNVLLRNVKSGDPLWRIDPVEHSAIRLRATLFTKDERVTPVLKSWRVDYTFECQK
ncbi:MAG: PQQ-like beta-propeller repeat protein [Anaerolineae bacterium]|nr:PQQ-like beta-propeller repeat protein [Anaerolineae bacterium]